MKEYRIVTVSRETRGIAIVNVKDSDGTWCGYTGIQVAILDRARLAARYPEKVFAVVEYITLEVDDD